MIIHLIYRLVLFPIIMFYLLLVIMSFNYYTGYMRNRLCKNLFLPSIKSYKYSLSILRIIKIRFNSIFLNYSPPKVKLLSMKLEFSYGNYIQV